MKNAYGFDQEKWDSQKEEIRKILIQKAHGKKLISYGDLAKLMTITNLDDRKEPFFEMLGEISRDEHSEGRGMLTVVVINQEFRVPGRGFFTVARELGHAKANELEILAMESSKVFYHWEKNPPNDES